MKNIVILGAGTAGTTMASRLRKVLAPKDWTITIVDRDDDHVYQPGLLLIPFGQFNDNDLIKPRHRFVPEGVRLRVEPIDRIEAAHDCVHLGNGETLPYDILVIATGCRIAPEATEGLVGEGWYESAFDFYTPAGARALAKRLETFTAGRLVINIAAMPIKCPVAPLEFAFLADAYFCKRGVREDIKIVYATPLDGAFTKPIASRMLGDLLGRKGIVVEPDFSVSEVDGANRVMTSYDGRRIPYDLLVTVPIHFGDEVIERSGLGDDMAFVPTDKHTLRSVEHDNIFVLGDATNVPASKAGSVAHFQSEVALNNILRSIDGRPLEPTFDGHTNCFIETGFDRAMLIDFNYDTEPLPGRYPLPGLGPLTLLEESHVNHWAKLAFEWAYWNVLLTGAPLPLDHRMSLAGKWSDR